ncbi:MAG: Fic family protein [Runella sp.]
MSASIIDPLLILSDRYLNAFVNMQPFTLEKHIEKLRRRGQKVTEFPFNIAESAVYSSNIEGNPIDYETYLKYHDLQIKPQNKSFDEIQDLIKAYEYAATHRITLKSLLKVHRIAAKTLLKKTGYEGAIRDKPVFVYKGREKIYTAVEASEAPIEMNRLIEDITNLTQRKLSLSEVFYYASMVHLRFVQIHPFIDGNGRSARLLEKWFLAQFIGTSAWLIHSERYYYRHLTAYYSNINLGFSYTTLNYDKCMPFLLMLPAALRYSYKE